MPFYEHHQKLLILLLNDDIENVFVGIELADTLFDDIEDLYELLRVNKERNENSEISIEETVDLQLYSKGIIEKDSHEYLFNLFLQNGIHKQTLDLWLLIKLHSFDFLEEERLPKELYIHTKYIPSDLCTLRSIKKITITNQHIPPEIPTLDQVETLVVRTENSGMYQRSRKYLLRMLRFRRLTGNVDISLPIELFEGPIANSLRTLDISYTNINNIPPQIGNLINLERLEVKKTDIKEIPKEIVKCNIHS